MKFEPAIKYEPAAMDSLSLVLAVAKEYREADGAMKQVLLKAVQNFVAPPLIAVADAEPSLDIPPALRRA